MNEYDVIRLGLILAVQAEIEGMKAESKQCEIQGDSLAYTDFYKKANELTNLSHAHDEQLI